MIIRDYKKDIKAINRDFTSTYFAMYMQGEWGVQVGYVPVPMVVVNMNKTIADWQIASDCCSLCYTSTLTQSFTISQYAALATDPNTCFCSLFSGGSCSPCFVNQSLNTTVNGSC